MIYEVLQVKEKTDIKVRKPSDIMKGLKPYFNGTQEQFIVLSLDGSHSIVASHTVHIGTANRTIVHARDVLRHAIIDNASGIIVAHNHPSGHLDPSTDDIETTKTLKEASELVGILLLDHIIFQDGTNYFSFKEHDLVLG